MSAWKRGADSPGSSRGGGGGGRWAPCHRDSRHVAAEEDYDDYKHDDRRHPYDHQGTHHHRHSSGGTRGATTRPGGRHERRRKRSRGRRADYDSASDTSVPSGTWEDQQDYLHHRRTRQRWESSPHRRHRHRRRSASSSRGRDTRHPQRQQEQWRRGDKEPHATERRTHNEEGVSRPVAATAAERRQQQLFSALDSQLASYRGRGPCDADANGDVNSGRRLQHEDQKKECGGTGSATVPSTRVVLYGVDLGVQPCHLSSMLEQLVGQRPLSVFRPAAVLRQSLCETATTGVGAPLAGRSADNCLRLGLYEVGGAGGVVVMELPRDSELVASVVAALNGAYVNGSPITAVAGC
ncbi:hypothetical protein TraAM80_07551 [Trypanosoma rangeli]|uniref:Uncharacterized protein n=1 Tax=Trypanosoma rangeli TaxID=5698 RepID=A0A3R7KSS4_TRYRA|nr:uncharacterized protein TraAM80_07551 [Trypanosoma rangeli]RNF00628.1 hypothetical protein TraAM80_07551 [Trypanosoma rangeli]|eukprot:RNF00628.1 hypothetical protein TraAM80_07551 [Trypanosoma rangeli]